MKSGVALVLDPDHIVSATALEGDVVPVEDWWALRREYELRGRRRTEHLPVLTIMVGGALALVPPPWDIQQASDVVVTLRLPGPPSVREALAELNGAELSLAISAVKADPADPESALLRLFTGVEVRARQLRRADQLRLAARLAVNSPSFRRLAEIARRWVQDPVAAALLSDPPSPEELQRVWQQYIDGADEEWADELALAGAEVGQLFAVGLLKPVVSEAPAEAWAAVGVRRPSSEDRAQRLLAAAPQTLPTDLAGWIALADWWGDVRRLVSAAPELRESAWLTWETMDAAFLPWLRRHYGPLLSSAARWPTSVHRIAHFLARRVRDGEAKRLLLLVLDGLGHAQWGHLRERLPLEVIEAGSVLALLPTYTTVSRQAIFAGDLPSSFADSLWTTQPEPRRWRQHWMEQGFASTDVAYHRVKGRLPHDHVVLGNSSVVGVVVNAVDDLMHTSELLGDAQLFANLDVWADNGFLVDLVRRATHDGFETWITADHGNLECIGTGSVSEGVAIESSGKRLLRYPNVTLRDASAAQGIVWDDIPGMPSTAEPLLFASARHAFTNHRISISHGGLSIDEAIVPLVRVAA